MTRRQFLSTLFTGFTVAGLSACGRKNQPKHPPGSEFPHEYPYLPPDRRAPRSVDEPEAKEAPQDKSDYLRLDPIQNRSR